MGRFQPFHLGHLRVIEKIKEDGFKEVVIVIGSAQYAYTKENPFTAKERMRMIDAVMKGTGMKYYLIPVNDMDSDLEWISAVEALAPKFDVVYANGLVKKLFEEAGYEVVEIFIEDEKKRISGTKIRKMIVDGDERWRELVPEEVYKKMLKFNGVERIKAYS